MKHCVKGLSLWVRKVWTAIGRLPLLRQQGPGATRKVLLATWQLRNKVDQTFVALVVFHSYDANILSYYRLCVVSIIPTFPFAEANHAPG